MLVARELTQEYQSGGRPLAVLRDVSFSIPRGAFVAIVGPSGSGKTTLLGLLAGLDTPSRGTVLLDGADLAAMSEDQRRTAARAEGGLRLPELPAHPHPHGARERAGAARAAWRRERRHRRARPPHRASASATGTTTSPPSSRAASSSAWHRAGDRERARAILSPTSPPGNLDAGTRSAHRRAARDLKPRVGTTVALVTHDLRLAAAPAA
jgi:putative ABC transport system ATP-binding protein